MHFFRFVEFFKWSFLLLNGARTHSSLSRIIRVYCISLPLFFSFLVSSEICGYVLFQFFICKMYFHHTDNFDKWAYVPWCTWINKVLFSIHYFVIFIWHSRNLFDSLRMKSLDSYDWKEQTSISLYHKTLREKPSRAFF